ncbi:MAG TPA: Spy/CpxP family protein refolding chaperone [Candidatus Dormibacteraeota bacterium]|nr:Spy/CpxP family protein refolding chaperone [Candidatus Dormibacteraeota bacterium]
MKSFRFRLLIAALAVLMGSAIAKSQTADDTTPTPPMHRHEYGMGHMGMDGHMMGFFARKLNLTDEQKTQMHSIMDKEHPAMKALHQQERQVDLQLRQYVEGTYDEAKVQTIAAQKAQIEVQITVAHTRIHNQMYQLLTADQKAQLKQMEADHEARMQQHMNHEPAASPEQ